MGQLYGKEENDDYKSVMQSDTAAKELLLFEKNRLNKFYNPKLYKPAAKEELSDQGAIERDMSFVQAFAHRQLQAVEPPPETWDAYAKKSEVMSTKEMSIQTFWEVSLDIKARYPHLPESLPREPFRLHSCSTLMLPDVPDSARARLLADSASEDHDSDFESDEHGRISEWVIMQMIENDPVHPHMGEGEVIVKYLEMHEDAILTQHDLLHYQRHIQTVIGIMLQEGIIAPASEHEPTDEYRVLVLMRQSHGNDV